MYSIWFTCIVAVLAGAVDSKNIDGQGPMINDRIYKGQDANIEDFPYQVSLQWNGRHICGGSIINPTVILTAGHCVNVKNPQYYTIRAGSTYHNRDGVIRNVTKIIKHEYFNEINFYGVLLTIRNDIALLILSDDLEFSNTIQPIKIPNENDEIKDGDLVSVTGWGRLTPDKRTEILQKTEIPIFNQELCQREYFEISPSVLCAGFYQPNATNVCYGDSGGPLVKNGVVYGLVSYGNKICTNKPSVFTRVSAFVKWINEKINIE